MMRLVSPARHLAKLLPGQPLASFYQQSYMAKAHLLWFSASHLRNSQKCVLLFGESEHESMSGKEEDQVGYSSSINCLPVCRLCPTVVKQPGVHCLQNVPWTQLRERAMPDPQLVTVSKSPRLPEPPLLPDHQWGIPRITQKRRGCFIN